MTRHVVAAAREIPEGGRKLVTVRGRPITIFNVKGEFFALYDRCPHEGGSLCRGKLTGLVRSDGSAVLVDTFEHNFVLAHMKTVAACAADRLHSDLGRPPEVVNRHVPRLANRLPVFVEQRFGVGADPHRADVEAAGQ